MNNYFGGIFARVIKVFVISAMDNNYCLKAMFIFVNIIKKINILKKISLSLMVSLGLLIGLMVVMGARPKNLAANGLALGQVLGHFNTPGGSIPSGLAHNWRGYLYLTEVENDEVILMTTSGTEISKFSIATNTVTAVGITSAGYNLYLTDPHAPYTNTVAKYTQNGNYNASFNIAAQTSFPEGISYNPHNHNLYVVDGDSSLPNTVLEYSIAGNLVATYPLTTTSADGIAYDAARCTYWLYDSDSDTVIHYSPVFTTIESFRGSNLAGFGNGEGLAVIADILYLVAPASKVVVVFSLQAANTIFVPLCQTPTTVYLPMIWNSN